MSSGNSAKLRTPAASISAKTAGKSVMATEPPPAKTPAHSPSPQTITAPRIDRVLDHQTRDDAAGDYLGRHARAAERPRGDSHPARAVRCNEADRRDPGERDLQTHTPVDPRHATTEHGPKQSRVASYRQQLQRGGRREPQRIAAAKLTPRLLQAASFGIRKYTPTSATTIKPEASSSRVRVIGTVGPSSDTVSREAPPADAAAPDVRVSSGSVSTSGGILATSPRSPLSRGGNRGLGHRRRASERSPNSAIYLA